MSLFKKRIARLESLLNPDNVIYTTEGSGVLDLPPLTVTSDGKLEKAPVKIAPRRKRHYSKGQTVYQSTVNEKGIVSCKRLQ